MHPVTWNDLPDIQDVPRLDDDDHACLKELGDVLRRHGKTRRFGAALLHNHFQLADDELLVEHCDFPSRTLTVAPESRDQVIRDNYLPTVWRFDGALAQACSYCPTHGDQHAGHKDQH